MPTNPHAAAIAAEELTGLALQERGLTTLLARQAAESGDGPRRARVQAHLEQSRAHQQIFSEQASALGEHRGAPELAAGVLRSGAAALGAVGASIAQLATAPIALVRKGAQEERLLENFGVEGAALANKLVILTAVTRALELSGATAAHTAIDQVRKESQQTWETLIGQTPEVMGDLVTAKAA